MKPAKTESLSEDEIRKMFSPRPITAKEDTTADFGKIDILRTVKKNSFRADAYTESKDHLLSEEGPIGAQG